MNQRANHPDVRILSSIVMKVIVIVSAMIGTFLSAYAGRNSFMGGTSVMMYFTIQSNIGIALICALGAVFMLKQKLVSRVWQIIKLVGTVSITLTGFVFCFVLAPTMGQAAWSVPNVLTHVVVPLVSVIDFSPKVCFTPMKTRMIFGSRFRRFCTQAMLASVT